jgi:hypothetical protein
MCTVSKEKVDDMQATDLSGAVWRRSSYSGGDNGSQCVEVAVVTDRAAVRDSKVPAAPVLAFPVATLTAFVAVARRGHWHQR